MTVEANNQKSISIPANVQKNKNLSFLTFGKELAPIFDILKNHTYEITMEIKDGIFKIKELDSSHVAMIDIEIPVKNLEPNKIEKDFRFSFNSKEFYNIFKEKGTEPIFFTYFHKSKKAIMTKNKTKIEIKDLEMEVDSYPNIEMKASSTFRIGSEMLKEALKEAERYTDFITFRYGRKSLTISASDAYGGITKRILYNKERNLPEKSVKHLLCEKVLIPNGRMPILPLRQLVETGILFNMFKDSRNTLEKLKYALEKQERAMYCLSYLKEITKLNKLTDAFTITIDQNPVMKLVAKWNEEPSQNRITYYLAPRVEEEDFY